MNKNLIIIFIMFGLSLIACAEKTTDPDTQLRAWLTELEVAIKGKDIGSVANLLDDRYLDAGGNNKAKRLLQLRLLFKRYQEFGMTNHISEIEITPPTARMIVETRFAYNQAFAQMGISQNNYQFILLFSQKEQQWQLNSLSYQPKVANGN